MDEFQKELERARSKVRRRLSYGAAILFAFLVLWGALWMTDRSIMMVGISNCIIIVSYWFGTRNQKPPEPK